jgi:hypothetical protein
MQEEFSISAFVQSSVSLRLKPFLAQEGPSNPRANFYSLIYKGFSIEKCPLGGHLSIRWARTLSGRLQPAHVTVHAPRLGPGRMAFRANTPSDWRPIPAVACAG